MLTDSFLRLVILPRSYSNGFLHSRSCSVNISRRQVCCWNLGFAHGWGKSRSHDHELRRMNCRSRSVAHQDETVPFFFDRDLFGLVSLLEWKLLSLSCTVLQILFDVGYRSMISFVDIITLECISVIQSPLIPDSKCELLMIIKGRYCTLMFHMTAVLPILTTFICCCNLSFVSSMSCKENLVCVVLLQES